MHTCAVSMVKIMKIMFELLQHPPDLPDLAPSDFSYFQKNGSAVNGSSRNRCLFWGFIERPSYNKSHGQLWTYTHLLLIILYYKLRNINIKGWEKSRTVDWGSLRSRFEKNNWNVAVFLYIWNMFKKIHKPWTMYVLRIKKRSPSDKK